MRLRTFIPLAALALLLTACHGRRHARVVVKSEPQPHPVSIEVEVYDPVSGFVWQDVGVRVVEAYTEWSDCLCESPYLADYYYTDSTGVVYLSEFDLADADVGFVEDASQRAVLEYPASRDEATVTLEISALTFDTIYVDVALSWDEPDVFVSVPFE